jgi:pimeloyl-ACP methyl ester carboxylesterase
MAFDWSVEGPQTLEAGGKRLEAQAWGPGPEDAPTIVLLHEGLGCLALWRDFPERLAGRRASAWSLFPRRAMAGRMRPNCPARSTT